ncbi:glycosyltransferase BC10-like [Silene latifolia]|uniref:glycosyltransferase BC10-like n=1 Tax=Silene latifolia TaxID=37657 RepID=UPI003D786A70
MLYTTLDRLKMKVMYAHLNSLKLFSYYLLLATTLMTLAIVLAFGVHRFSSFNLTLTPPKQLHALTKPSIISNGRLPVLANNIRSSDYLIQSDEMQGIMSDEELMRRAASMIPETEKTVPKTVPKIAFLFLIKGSLPLAPLWEEFFKGHQGFYSIYVHSDASAYNYFRELETGVFRGRTIPSKEVEWAKFSMVEAELRLTANALLDISNQRFVLLSESCIPLFNFTAIYSYLMNSTKTYVDAYDLVGHVGRGRYKRGLYPNVTLRQWRKGSQWFEMDRELAVKVISDQSYFNLFKGVCESSWYPCCADEHYLPTWVDIHYRARNSNRSLTWADWSAGGAHPAMYMNVNITAELLEKLRSNQTCVYNGMTSNICYLFARKFAPNTLDKLLTLAPQVLSF